MAQFDDYIQNLEEDSHFALHCFTKYQSSYDFTTYNFANFHLLKTVFKDFLVAYFELLEEKLKQSDLYGIDEELTHLSDLSSLDFNFIRKKITRHQDKSIKFRSRYFRVFDFFEAAMKEHFLQQHVDVIQMQAFKIFKDNFKIVSDKLTKISSSFKIANIPDPNLQKIVDDFRCHTKARFSEFEELELQMIFACSIELVVQQFCLAILKKFQVLNKRPSFGLDLNINDLFFFHPNNFTLDRNIKHFMRGVTIGVGEMSNPGVFDTLSRLKGSLIEYFGLISEIPNDIIWWQFACSCVNYVKNQFHQQIRENILNNPANLKTFEDDYHLDREMR